MTEFELLGGHAELGHCESPLTFRGNSLLRACWNNLQGSELIIETRNVITTLKLESRERERPLSLLLILN